MEKLRNEVGLAILPAPIFVIVTLLWCTLAGILLLGLLAQIWEIISTAAPTADSSFEWRFAMVRLTALTATFGAVIALPFTIVRLVYMRRQTETAAETLVSDKEALFNDKINTAVSDLHAQRKITKWKNGEADNGWEDDVTRRNGAIDRLLGLAKEEPESAPRIARMLSVYVKELSREYPAKAPPQTDDFILLKEWADNLTFARSDMQNAVQVLGKLREASGQPLNIWDIDLSGTNLQSFDLQFLDFENVSFIKAHLRVQTFCTHSCKEQISQTSICKVLTSGTLTCRLLISGMPNCREQTADELVSRGQISGTLSLIAPRRSETPTYHMLL